MDEAWLWGTLFGIATLLSGSMAALAQQKIDTSPQFGWWCLILAPMPLIVWNIAWVIMAQPSDSIRRPMALVVGAIAGAVILFGVSELISERAKAQPTAPPLSPVQQQSAAPVIQQNNGGAPGQLFNAPGGSIYVNPPAAPSAKATAENDSAHIYQAGVVVGKVFGGRRVVGDATRFEFREITNCNQFNPSEPFYYTGTKLLFLSNQDRIGLDISRPQDGMIRSEVLAKVVE